MKNIYVSGDSFCYDRSPDSWVTLLSNNLNSNLSGQGFPGYGWWITRNNLINFKKNDPIKWADTELFVFCHTGPDRLLSTVYPRHYIKIPTKDKDLENQWRNIDLVNEVYYKYLYEKKFHDWAMTSWFYELNRILEGKNVIHLFCFQDSFELSHILNGHKLNGSLYTWAENDTIRKGYDYNTVPTMNHLLLDSQKPIADFLANYYLSEIKDKGNQTKYFNIDI